MPETVRIAGCWLRCRQKQKEAKRDMRVATSSSNLKEVALHAARVARHRMLSKRTPEKTNTGIVDAVVLQQTETHTHTYAPTCIITFIHTDVHAYIHNSYIPA